ncbi:hypothetical protein ACH5RR_003268, partial [Cinchona calisaya]
NNNGEVIVRGIVVDCHCEVANGFFDTRNIDGDDYSVLLHGKLVLDEVNKLLSGGVNAPWTKHTSHVIVSREYSINSLMRSMPLDATRMISDEIRHHCLRDTPSLVFPCLIFELYRRPGVWYEAHVEVTVAS